MNNPNLLRQEKKMNVYEIKYSITGYEVVSEGGEEERVFTAYDVVNVLAEGHEGAIRKAKDIAMRVGDTSEKWDDFEITSLRLVASIDD